MVSTKGDPAPLRPTQPTGEVLAAEHPTDAHFTCYGVLEAPGTLADRIPRLTKGVLPLLVEYGLIQHTTQVVGTALAIDFDLPDHAKWTPAMLAQAKDAFDRVSQANPIFATPTCWYTTSGGCRYVWILTEPVSVEGPGGLEDLLGGLVAAGHLAGLKADPSCRDWTRHFRLPRVQRADKAPAEQRTQDQPYFRMSWGRVDTSAREMDQPAVLRSLSPKQVRPLSQFKLEEFNNDQGRPLAEAWKHRIGRDPVVYDARQVQEALGNAPTDGTVAALMHAAGGKSPQLRQVEHFLEADAHPKSKKRKPFPPAVQAYEVLTGVRPIFLKPDTLDQLHEGVLALAKNLCASLLDKLGPDPGQISAEFIYALVLDAARRGNEMRIKAQMPSARDNATLTAEVWSAVGHVYRRFRFQALLDHQERAEAESNALVKAQTNRLMADGIQDAIKAQFRAWAIESNPGAQERLRASKQLAEQSGALAADSIIDTTLERDWRKYLILETPDGRSVISYSSSGEIGYSPLAKTDGAFYAAVRDCGHTLVRDEEPAARPGDPPRIVTPTHLMRLHGSQAVLRFSRLIKHPQLRLRLDDNNKVQVELVAKAAGMRHDIEPKYDAQVDEWLHTLGGAMAPNLQDWLAAYPRIDQKIAGLYLQGPPDVGKGMLGLALANMTMSGIAAPFAQVIDQFQDTMIKTPFVWADEESTSTHRSGRSVMNMYKKLVTGELGTLNAKGKSMTEIEGYWRVLMTANSNKLLQGDEDTNDQDLKALIQRTLHIKIDGEGPRRFLDKIGGSEGTRGWPERNIPQHIMWLRHNRQIIPGGRLLVEGVRGDFHEDMKQTTGGADMVTRALGKILQEPARFPKVVKIIPAETGAPSRVLVNSSELHPVIEQMFPGRSSKPPTQKQVQTCLKRMAIRDKSENFRISNAGRTGVVSRGWPINVSDLITALERLDENYDLRHGLGEAVWNEHAPERIRNEIAGLSQPVPAHANGHTNGHTNGHAPAPPRMPPPPPTSSNVPLRPRAPFAPSPQPSRS
jgi:hypothetical protein